MQRGLAKIFPTAKSATKLTCFTTYSLLQDAESKSETSQAISAREHFVFTDTDGQVYHITVEGNTVKDGARIPPDVSQFIFINVSTSRSSTLDLAHSCYYLFHISLSLPPIKFHIALIHSAHKYLNLSFLFPVNFFTISASHFLLSFLCKCTNLSPVKCVNQYFSFSIVIYTCICCISPLDTTSITVQSFFSPDKTKRGPIWFLLFVFAMSLSLMLKG